VELIHIYLFVRVVIDKRILFSFHQKSSVTNKMHQLFSAGALSRTPLGAHDAP